MSTITRKISFESSTVEMPVRLWQWNSFRLMTHAPVVSDGRGSFRVSEETTGYGIPRTFAPTEAEADALAVAVLTANRHKITSAMAGLPTVNPVAVQMDLATTPQ